MAQVYRREPAGSLQTDWIIDLGPERGRYPRPCTSRPARLRTPSGAGPGVRPRKLVQSASII